MEDTRSPEDRTDEQPDDKWISPDSEDFDDDSLLKTAREEFKAIDMREKDARQEFDRCMAFIALQQWNADAVANRGWNIPSLVVDHLGPIASQITNDWIRNRMAIEIAPADEVASEETAKVFSGYVRNVEYLSKAQTHVDEAFGQMVRGNRGYAGVLTERKLGTRKQCLVIRGFPDSQAVYLADFKRPDQMDLDHGFVRDSATEAEFKRLFPGAEMTEFSDWGADFVDWYSKGMVSWAEYWKIHYRPRQIHFLNQPVKLLRDGKSIQSDSIYSDELKQFPNMPDGMIEESEDEPERQVWQYLITGKEILSRTRWLGKIVPIVPFTGRVVYLKGKKYIFSAISSSLDSQCQLNYAESSAAEQMGSTVHTPYVGWVGQFKTQVQSWMKANVVRFPFLEADIIYDQEGHAIVDKPTQQNNTPQIAAYLEAATHAAENIRLTSGLNKSSLGIDDSRAKSGVAKKVDVAEGDNSSFDWHARGAASLAVLGDILVDVAPKIIGKDEIIQILDEQEKQKAILVNSEVAGNPKAPKGQEVAHYLDRGEYRVRIGAAPSHQTMREETKEELGEFYSESMPEQKAVLLPWLIRASNMTGKEDLANQVSLPQYQKQPDGAKPIPPEAQAAIQQGHQLIQMGQEEIARLNRIIDSKILELEAKKEMSAADNETKIAVAEISKMVAGFQEETAAIKNMLDIMMQQAQMAQGQSEAEAGRQHEQGMQDAAQAHQAGMQEQQLTAQQQQAREAAPQVAE